MPEVWLQGINYLAGMLLLVLQKKEEWAFWILVSLLDEGATLPQPPGGVVASLQRHSCSVHFEHSNARRLESRMYSAVRALPVTR